MSESTKKILIIEDDPRTFRLVASLLVQGTGRDSDIFKVSF